MFNWICYTFDCLDCTMKLMDWLVACTTLLPNIMQTTKSSREEEKEMHLVFWQNFSTCSWNNKKAFLTTAFASSCDCFDRKQISWEFKGSGVIFLILIKIWFSITTILANSRDIWKSYCMIFLFRLLFTFFHINLQRINSR